MDPRVAAAGAPSRAPSSGAGTAFAALARGLRRAFPEREPPFTTPEQFELELLELGLSGKTFGPRDYAAPLQERLGLRIVLELMNDAHHPEFLRRLVGDPENVRLAETHYLEEKGIAVVLFPASLPPLVLALTAFHELSHLAAGDHLIDAHGNPKAGPRLSARPQLPREPDREEEADRRAVHALLAGTLGVENPYAMRLHDPV